MMKIEQELWDILNKYRGNVENINLKYIFISLLFLKKANDEYIDDISLIVVPNVANWDYLKTLRPDSNFLQHLYHAFHSLEKENFTLNNTFSQFSFDRRFSNRNSNSIIDLFYRIDSLNTQVDNLSFNIVIGRLLSRFATSQGMRGRDFLTPRSVSKLMVDLIVSEQSSVLDSTCGTGGFFVDIMSKYPKGNFAFYGQEWDTEILAIAKLRFAFEARNHFEFGLPEDSLENDQFLSLKVDNVIMHPPLKAKNQLFHRYESDPRFQYGIPPKSNSNFAWIQHAIYHLKETGEAAVLLNNSSLTSIGKEGDIRKKLLQAGKVSAIISLPSQLLVNTSIPVSIWLLNNDEATTNDVLFIDGRLDFEKTTNFQNTLRAQDIDRLIATYKNWKTKNGAYHDVIGYSKSAGVQEIIANNYQLAPSRYVGIAELENFDWSSSIRLKELLTVVKPNSIEPESVFKTVSVKDLSKNPDAYVLNIENLSKKEIQRHYKSLPDDVLLISRIGTNIKPTYFKSSEDVIAYSFNSIFAFKVKTELIYLDYLIAELYKDYVLAQIDQNRKNVGIPSINTKDFLNVRINIPKTIDQQVEIVEREREMRFQSVAKDLGFENEIAKLKEAQMKDLGAKKHNIMQHLNNVKSSTDVLIKMMNINEGVLKANEVIDPRRGVTVEKRFLRLQQSLDSVIYYVDNITNDIQYGTAEIINPVTVLKDCKEKGIENSLFSIELIIERETFDGISPLIKISSNDFEEIYNNLLENAIKHGFVDKSKKYIYRITVALIDGFVQISFENNGKAFPKGMSKRYNIKGEKAGASSGSGIGLWKVSEIANHFDVIIDVVDVPENEFPVGFKLKFKLETSEL